MYCFPNFTSLRVLDGPDCLSEWEQDYARLKPRAGVSAIEATRSESLPLIFSRG